MALTELAYIKKLNSKSKFKYYLDIDFPLEFNCYVTSEKGIFKIENGKLEKVLNLWVFGIALDKHNAFISCASDISQSYSYILSLDVKALTTQHIKLNMKELYRIPLSSKRQRIHQICLNENSIWAANTARNTLMEINRDNGCIIKEIAPFKDLFGKPILHDHNHINSIWHTGEALLFVAFRIGERSMIGVVGEDEIKGFAYRNYGAHDIAIRKKDFYFSDTLGKDKPDEGGCLIINGYPIDENFFQKPLGCIVRGIAGNNNQLVIGHSHKGKRTTRFDGKGALLFAQNNKIVRKIEMPFSQVYDIIRSDGKRFNEEPEAVSFSEVYELLKKYLGKPIYSEKVKDCIIKE